MQSRRPPNARVKERNHGRRLLSEIKNFFATYKMLEGKKTQVEGGRAYRKPGMSSGGVDWRAKRRKPVRMSHKNRTQRRPRSRLGMKELEATP